MEKLYKDGNYDEICRIINEADVVAEWEKTADADKIKRIMTIGIISALKCGDMVKVLDLMLMSQKVLWNIKHDILRQLKDLIENHDYNAIEQLKRVLGNNERLYLYLLLGYYYLYFLNDIKAANYFIEKIGSLYGLNLMNVDEVETSLSTLLSKDIPETINAMKKAGFLYFEEWTDDLKEFYKGEELLDMFRKRVLEGYVYSGVLKNIFYCFYRGGHYDLMVYWGKRLEDHKKDMYITMSIENIAQRIFEKGRYLEAYNILKETGLLGRGFHTIRIWFEYLWKEGGFRRVIEEISKGLKGNTVNKIYFLYFLMEKVLEYDREKVDLVIKKVAAHVDTDTGYYENIKMIVKMLELFWNYGAEENREYAAVILDKMLYILKDKLLEEGILKDKFNEERYIVWSLLGLNYALLFSVKIEEFSDHVARTSFMTEKFIYNFNFFCSITGYLKSLPYYDVYMEITEKSGSRMFKALSFIRLAELLIKNGKEEKAVELINKSLDIFQGMIADYKTSPDKMLYKMEEVIKEPFSFFMIFPYNLLDVISKIKDEKFKFLWDRVLDLFTKEGFGFYVVNVLLELGKYEESIDVIKGMDSDEEKVESFNEVFKYLINYKDRQYIFDVVDNVLLKEIKDPYRLSDILRDVSFLFVDSDDYESAEKIILKSPQTRDHSLILRDIMYHIIEKHSKDEGYLSKVLDIVDKINNKDVKYEALILLLQRIVKVEDEAMLERLINMIEEEDDYRKDIYYYELAVGFLRNGRYDTSKRFFGRISDKNRMFRLKEVLLYKIILGVIPVNDENISFLEDTIAEMMTEMEIMKKAMSSLTLNSCRKKGAHTKLTAILERYWHLL